MGLAKHVLTVDAERTARAASRRCSTGHFIAEHCHGFEAFRDHALATDWAEIERHSGLHREDLEAAADVYIAADRTIAVYGMGLTQHVHGSQTLGLLTNLLLLKGNIGRPGTGMSPMRGHSNVQGQRTVGMSEKPELVPLDRLAELFDFEPPREKGRTTVEVCEGVIDGSVKGFIGARRQLRPRHSRPRPRMEPAWRQLELTVQIATKLNRSHLINGRSAWLLPCLARSEEDMQASGAAVGVDGGHLQPHPRLDRQAHAGQRAPEVRARDRGRDWPRRPCRRTRSGAGTNGPPTTAGFAS